MAFNRSSMRYSASPANANSRASAPDPYMNRAYLGLASYNPATGGYVNPSTGMAATPNRAYDNPESNLMAPRTIEGPADGYTATSAPRQQMQQIRRPQSQPNQWARAIMAGGSATPQPQRQPTMMLSTQQSAPQYPTATPGQPPAVQFRMGTYRPPVKKFQA